MKINTAEALIQNWTGRTDPEADSWRWHQKIQPVQSDSPAGMALIGFACDAGVQRNHGRPGAIHGPQALRKQLANLPWLQTAPLYECGDIVCDDGDLETAQQQLASHIAAQLQAGHQPIVLGGGHEIAFASWSGLAQHLAATESQPRIGIINFDAHFDLRDPQCQATSSGTPFAQIAEVCAHKHWMFHYACFGVSRMSNTPALFNRADALGVCYAEDLQMTVPQLNLLQQRLDRFMQACDHLYLTIDLDVFPASQAPGVSAPAARGVSLEVIEPLLIQIRNSGKLRLMDLAELNPELDIDAHTARLAARLIHQMTLTQQ